LRLGLVKRVRLAAVRERRRLSLHKPEPFRLAADGFGIEAADALIDVGITGFKRSTRACACILFDRALSDVVAIPDLDQAIRLNPKNVYAYGIRREAETQRNFG
jgi:hypothetical protein